MTPEQLQQLQLAQEINQILNSLYWFVGAILVGLLAKEIVMRWIDGYLWRRQSTYINGCIVKINGKLERITHLGKLKTELTQYTIRKNGDGKAYIAGGWTHTVENSELQKLEIMKPLEVIPQDMLEEFVDVQ